MVFIIYNKSNENKYIINIKVNGLDKKEEKRLPFIKLIIHLVEPQLKQYKP